MGMFRILPVNIRQITPVKMKIRIFSKTFPLHLMSKERKLSSSRVGSRIGLVYMEILLQFPLHPGVLHLWVHHPHPEIHPGIEPIPLTVKDLVVPCIYRYICGVPFVFVLSENHFLFCRDGRRNEYGESFRDRPGSRGGDFESPADPAASESEETCSNRTSYSSDGFYDEDSCVSDYQSSECSGGSAKISNSV